MFFWFCVLCWQAEPPLGKSSSLPSQVLVGCLLRVSVCVLFLSDRPWQTHTRTHTEDPESLGWFENVIILEKKTSPWRWPVPRGAGRHPQAMLICVERVILGYTVLPTVLVISPLSSQSQPRTQWCSASLTGGIPWNCYVTMLAQTAQSLSCLCHTSCRSHSQNCVRYILRMFEWELI